MMGCRSAPYCCQHTTNFIRHIMNNLQHFILNYVDDFMGIHFCHRAWQAFAALENLLRDLGVKEANDKAIPPSNVIEFLGVLFDFRNFTILVTLDRLKEFREELQKWEIGQKFR